MTRPSLRRRPVGQSAPVRGRGFTLIELLVVIAIIAILAAILFPVYARAKERARLTQCISNMKQLSIAILSYADDYDGTLPWWCLSPCGQVWDQSIWDYVRDKSIYTCPKNHPPGWQPGDLVRSYALPRNVSGLSHGEIRSPARAVLLFEKGNQPFGIIADATGESYWQTWGTDEWTSRAEAGANPWSADSRKARTYWHGGGKVLAFVDGHAKYYSVKDQDPERNPFWYDFPGNLEHGGDHAPGYCGDAVHHYGYTGCTDHTPGANLPP